MLPYACRMPHASERPVDPAPTAMHKPHLHLHLPHNAAVPAPPPPPTHVLRSGTLAPNLYSGAPRWASCSAFAPLPSPHSLVQRRPAAGALVDSVLVELVVHPGPRALRALEA